MTDGSLVAFGNWLQNRPFALAVLTTDWAYPFVRATHFAGLSLFIGTTVATDLSLIGVGKRYQSPTELLEAVLVWNWIGFFVALVGGFLLFAASAATYVANPAFQIKLGFLIPVALVLHIAIQHKMPNLLPRQLRIAGWIELLLWVSVISAAVSIPSFG